MNTLEGKMNDGGERISYGKGMAVREPSEGKGRYDLLSPFATRRLAKWYELGAQKYAPRNWERGMPFSRYIDSAKRHIDKYIMGMEDEDHLAAAVWNLFAIMHHEELGQNDLDDLPHYLSEHEVKVEADENPKQIPIMFPVEINPPEPGEYMVYHVFDDKSFCADSAEWRPDKGWGKSNFEAVYYFEDDEPTITHWSYIPATFVPSEIEEANDAE